VNRDLLWEALRWSSLEHVTVRSEPGAILADGLIVAHVDGRPVRLAYSIRCDPEWRVRSVNVDVLPDGPGIRLISDGDGHWHDQAGRALPELDGATDVDISLTPLTNTLPIRRLGLAEGESRSIRVAYVDAPSLEARAAEQRYTCLASGPEGGSYLYESGSFHAELTVDADGFVIDYEGLWRRARESAANR
jgi:uncharacterized protein